MRRREFLKFVGAAGVLAAAGNVCECFAADDKKPNFLFIFADDQCFETVASLGNDEIETPNLDRLVRNGVTFTHAYNQGGWHGAVCVASRTMLNTGRFVWNARDAEKVLNREALEGRMWSPILQKAGYETYMSGKWHVKMDAAKLFDHTVDIRPGMPNQTKEGYNRPQEGKKDVWSPYDKKFGGFWKGGKHWSEILADDAEGYLEQAAKKDDPFFMYMAFNAPHDPRQSPKEYVDKYPLGSVKVPDNFLPEYPDKDAIGCSKGLRDEQLAPFPRTEYSVKVNRQEYYAIVTHMDAQVGRILDALEKTGKADNTYIFFTADHGLGCGQHGLLGKQNMYDHSMRVPMMVCGPNVPKNKKLDTPVYLQDIMASTLDLAGIEKPDHVQFKSLMPLISGKKKSNYDAIYGAYQPNSQRMVTKGDYKLIMYPKIKKIKLFNLKADPKEMKNLAAGKTNASIITKLFKTFTELQKQTGDTLKINIKEYSAKGQNNR
jgi:arylsulfatase A-like enzyme